MSTVLVLVEVEADGISLVSCEALTVGSVLGDELHAFVLGATSQGVLADAADYGVAVVHEATDPAFARYAAAAWAGALADCVSQVAPSTVIAGGTPKGTEVLAHLAARLDVPMAANVVDITSLEPLEVERQVAGGAVLERSHLADAPALFTIAGHAFEAARADVRGAAEVEQSAATPDPSDLRAQVTRVEEAAGGDSSGLATARVVVGVGRGAGGEDGFARADALAERLGGVVGVSRVVTSMGWRPHHEQIGQSGTRISPDVYLAFGISGAAQHWAGCSSAKTIIAVNSDSGAPMVTKADYAVIGDMHEVLEALLEELG